MAGRRVLAFSVVNRSVILGAVWLVLTGASLDALIFGALAVPAAVWLSLSLLPPSYQLGLLRLLVFLPTFVAGSVRGGFDVAWRAFMPRIPIAPGWIVVPVDLPDGARVALGAELSLMPGTLVAGVQDGKLLVHVLDRDADHSGIARTERQIAGMIGLPAARP
jgi:multicomponent Na+:H+ antiporter subunit E